MTVLCQAKSSEPEHSLPMRFLVNYRGGSSSLSVYAQQALSCLLHACLFLWLQRLVMPCSTEKKPGMSEMFVAVVAKRQEEAHWVWEPNC